MNPTALLSFTNHTGKLAKQKSRWRSRIARPPPKGQVAGSNPARDANEINGLHDFHEDLILEYSFGDNPRDNQNK